LAFKAALWSRSISRKCWSLVALRGEGSIKIGAYWPYHAFTLTNVVGEQTRVKYKLILKAGQFGLGTHEAT
jgi:hypothetical protein